uniref:hypothetical protein n=1 Tax=Actinoplanes subtropicus TaxID=543632 RepID=UPI001B8037E6
MFFLAATDYLLLEGYWSSTGAAGALDTTQSGSDGALLRRRPLRTVRATRRGTRLKQATRA